MQPIFYLNFVFFKKKKKKIIKKKYFNFNDQK